VIMGERLGRFTDAALEMSVIGSFSRIGCAARRVLFDWDADPSADMAGKVVIITGATGGIGFAAAHAFAARRADVWLVGRDSARTESSRRRILAAFPGAHVTMATADLARLSDVRELAETVRSACKRLDVLVHNAGVLTHELVRTEDALELTAQVHVVAPFLLTTALLPLVMATPGARVITVSSGGMYAHALDLEELDAPPVPFDGVDVYANAKRAQVVLNERWAQQFGADGVVFHAMHPGWVDTPGVQTALPRFRALMRPLLRSPEQGADTIVWLASAPEPLAVNGAFWLDRARRLTNPLPWTRTSPQAATELWDWCTRYAHVEADLGHAT
jgi:NAD(P)-dependent dehydrogenase (short-subunit alcohol dehydrogenase family)